jgi:hypothetical protein
VKLEKVLNLTGMFWFAFLNASEKVSTVLEDDFQISAISFRPIFSMLGELTAAQNTTVDSDDRTSRSFFASELERLVLKLEN